MKQAALIWLMLMGFLAMPALAFAESYTVNNDEMTISFEDPGWIVFTKDNLNGNRELKKLGTDEKTMRSTMDKAHSCAVAVKGDEKQRMELLVRAVENEYINNMSTLTDKEMEALAAGVDENYSSELDEYASEIVESNGIRYIRMTGRYEKDGYDVVQYLTFVNGRNYLISVQKVIDFTKDDLDQIKGIIDSISFEIDTAKADNDVESYVKNRQDALSGSEKSMPTKILITVIVVIVIILALRLKNRKRR